MSPGDRLAIVTGGTKGLGRELTMAFARAGWEVLALYGHDEEAASGLRAELASSGLRGSCQCHDLASPLPLILPVARKMVLIHAACPTWVPRAIHQEPLTEFQRLQDVVVRGGWLAVQAVLKPMLREGGGVIVNVLSSAVGRESPRGFGSYLVAKHAVLGLTRALAADYRSRGIRVFSVSPRFMATEMTNAWPEMLRSAASAAGRTAPRDAADAILRLVTSPATPGSGEDYEVSECET